MLKRINILFLILLFVLTAYPAEAGLGGYSSTIGTRVPQPRIKQPSSDTVYLDGRTSVTFRWSPHERVSGAGGKYYDFRLYEGTEMIQSTLVFKKRVSGDQYTIELPAEILTIGQTYTWSLRLVYKTVGKSNRSVQTFRVLDKNNSDTGGNNE